MKKMFIGIMNYFIIFILVISSFTTVNAYEKTTVEEGSLNLMQVYENPELYPEYEVEVYSSEEFYNLISNDRSLSFSKKEDILDNITESSLDASTSYKYTTVNVNVPVNSSYIPKLQCYLKCEAINNKPVRFVSLLNADLHREYNGIVKQFGGNIYCNLESLGSFYWKVNGDFYNTGSTTVSGGFEIGIGESFNLSFKVSNTTNYYAYCNKDGRWTLH